MQANVYFDIDSQSNANLSCNLQQFPESLEQLVSAGYLQHLPRDGYSPRPLVYKPTADGFLLYSWGLDFDDDGGARSKWGQGEQGGDQVFWPLQTSD